jgi:glycosyltransferase involved in cell wall biosynthesis
MHVCYLCNEYPPSKHGGIGSFTQTLGRALVKRGNEVTVVGIYKEHNRRIDDDQGVRIVRLPHTSVPGAGFMFNGRRLLGELFSIHEELPIDIVEGPELSLAVISKAFPAKKVIRMHGGHHFFAVTLEKKPKTWQSWLERRSFKHADHLCAVSSFVAETTKKLLHLGNRPIEIIPNPVDEGIFYPRSNRDIERGNILFIGTVCEKKGVRQLIQAMPEIIQKFPDAKLHVVGSDWTDPRTGRSYIEYLNSATAPEIMSHVVFEGTIEHSRLPDIMAKAEICVYPSHMEALPLSWLEGLAMGKAIVASKTGPGPEVVEDGISGLLCDPFDPSSIAEKTIQILKDPLLGKRFGEQARKRAVMRFSIRLLVERNESFYQRCIKDNATV